METENRDRTVTPPQDENLQKGKPSSYLQEAIKNAATLKEGGVLDTEELFEGSSQWFKTTEANAEKGIFNIIGGAVDRKGNFHRQFQIRAMTGNEEDLLGDNSSDATSRMNIIMARCVEAIGTITDKDEINEMVDNLSSGSRTDLLLALRMVSHWYSEKDSYVMEIKCPFKNCRKKSTYKISLLDLDRYEPENPIPREFDVQLPVSKKKVCWKLLGSSEDAVLSKLGRLSEKDIITYAILMRLKSFDGEYCDFHPEVDFLDRNGKKVRLSEKAKRFYNIVKNLTVGDRDFLRSQFVKNETFVDTDIEVECEHCNETFDTAIDPGQPGFFFPQVTLTRLNRKRSF